MRCREILQKLTRGPTEPDPLHARMSVTQLIEEAAGPYRGFGAELVMTAAPEPGSEGAALHEPVGERRPGVIYGLGNLVENAVDFARERVEIAATWSAREVVIAIADDGPGVPADVMDALGEPYITTRPARPRGQMKDGEPSGLGLGFFIAKTLLERSGATVTLDNRPAAAARRHRQDQLAARGFREQAGGNAGHDAASRASLQPADADGGVH